MSNANEDQIDWSLTTWEGARREQRRRWALLPLENVIAALEEMQDIVEWLYPGGADTNAEPAGRAEPSIEQKVRKDPAIG